ncbi:MAG: hypothetical protein A2Y76_06710 [Planctomycetes bacterium RBG_13_60_9]|nr:MAG: hypothetical protein A2Y76_06710 [Planctomycetes bacterium RBG_13_60_9]
MVALVAILSATVYTADRNALPDSNSPAAKQTVKAQAAPTPASKPRQPAVRSPASFTRQMPFSEAIDILRNATKPPLNVVVLWNQIGSNAGVYRETPIGIDGVAGLRVGQYLDLLMVSLSAGASARLGYTVNQGVITISTTDALPAPKQVARVYDISDLVAPPARYFTAPIGFGGMGFGGPMMAPFGGYAGGFGAGYGLGAPYASTTYRR